MFRIDLDKNPTVKAKLAALLGDKFDFSRLAVFEALANDTLPINKSGSIYNQARMTNTYLSSMADKVNLGEFVPIIEQHDQSGKLPNGRIFDAKTYANLQNSDETDLHVLFYIDEKSEPQLVSKLESGSIAEVSTGSTPGSLLCSACGYDFLGGDDNRRRIYSGKNYTPLCAEGHQWGVGGNHLKLGSLGSWKETSLVTRGAATRAHILNEKEMRLAQDSGEFRLAAHADDDKLLLVTSQQEDLGSPDNGAKLTDINNGNKAMTDINLKREDYDTLILAQGKNTELLAKLSEAEKLKKEAIEAKAALEADKTLLETGKTELEAKLAETEQRATEAEAKLAVLSNKGGNAKSVEQGGENPNQDANLGNPSGLDDSYFKL